MKPFGKRNKRLARRTGGTRLTGPRRVCCVACNGKIKEPIQLPQATCEKIFKKSLKIVHPSFAKAMLDKSKNNNNLSFCEKCHEPISELVELNKKIETMQRELVSKSTELTIGILERRTKIESGNGHLDNVNHPGKKFIILDVTDIPLRYKSLVPELTAGEDLDEELNVTEDNIGTDTASPQDVVNLALKVETDDHNPRVLDSNSETQDISSQVVDADNHGDVTTVCVAASGVNQQHYADSISESDHSAYSATTTVVDKPNLRKGPKRLVKMLKDVDMTKLKRITKTKFSQHLDTDKGKSVSGKYGRRTQNTRTRLGKSSKSDAPDASKSDASKSDAPDASKNLRPKKNSHKCYECEKEFTSKRNLLNHSRIHFEKQVFACDQCEKVFCNQSGLTLHLRIHSGVKPFKCSFCEKTFTQKFNTHMHEAKIHLNELPYKCVVCKATFRYARDLNSHKKTHPVDKN